MIAVNLASQVFQVCVKDALFAKYTCECGDFIQIYISMCNLVGIAGLPGILGNPGAPGIPGVDGCNGTDGKIQ